MDVKYKKYLFLILLGVICWGILGLFKPEKVYALCDDGMNFCNCDCGLICNPPNNCSSCTISCVEYTVCGADAGICEGHDQYWGSNDCCVVRDSCIDDTSNYNCTNPSGICINICGTPIPGTTTPGTPGTQPGEGVPGAPGAPACTPYCPYVCGEADGCLGTCGNNGGTPGIPTLTPSEGIVTVDEGDDITVSWSSVTKATAYALELYPSGTDCSDANAHCYMLAGYSWTFSPMASSYVFRVQAYNSYCGGFTGSWASSTFSIVGAISGQVRTLDPGAETELGVGVGAVCTLQTGSATSEDPGEGSSVGIPGYSGGIGGDGTYSISSVPFGTGYMPLLDIGDSDNYRCECPSTCQYGGISSPQENVDFFVINFEDDWFQVQGGSLHADSGGVTSIIPDTCDEVDDDEVCIPDLIIKDENNAVGVVSYTGDLDLGGFGVNHIAEGGDDWQAGNTSYGGIETDYDYFYRLLEEDPDGMGAWGGDLPEGNGVFLFSGEEETVQTTGGDWIIPSGRIVVILVPKNVLINNNIIVEEDGFLAIISSGNITMADDVANVQGVYVADGVINTCESDTCGLTAGVGDIAEIESQQLKGEGIFVGWGGINLRRDFLSSDNDTNPGEMFIYRADLQVNAYNYLLKPFYTWREVAP